MLPAGYEPTIPAYKWPQTHALDHVVTGISCNTITLMLKSGCCPHGSGKFIILDYKI
jgi:hypothetical protein